MSAKFSLGKKARIAAALGLLAAAPVTWAEPLLQLYIEGSTYDANTETWVYTGTDPLRLWVIGNVNGPGGQGTISDVKLSIAYADGLTPTFNLTSSTTGGYLGYTDPSTPTTATLTKTVTDGTAPIMGNGSSLPTHGIYGSGTDWTEFLLGNFSLTDSQIGDFINSAPTASGGTVGQINVYEFSVTGVAEGTTFHFDAYDHVALNEQHLRYVFAPFSHDAEGGGGGTAPEPGSLTLLGLSLTGLAALRRRRKAA